MKFLSKERISNHRYKTPEGYLVCLDAIIARTGKQDYSKKEIFADSEDDDTIISIDRPYKEVFSPQTIASFENKPFVDEHPNEDVNVDNHRDYAIGFVRDVREATADGEDVLIANLFVTDAEAIAEIESGKKTELSCGYDCDILGDEDNYYQANIRGNHVALCKVGRAGVARIVDSMEEKEMIEDELIEPEQKYINEFEKELNSMRFKIVKTGKTWSGRIHYQIITKTAGYKDNDLKTFVYGLDKLSNKMKKYGIPMTYDIGLQYDGYISAGIDLDKQWVKDSIDDSINDSDKLKQSAYKFAQMGNYFDRANSVNSREILSREDDKKITEFYKLGLQIYEQLKQEVNYLRQNKKAGSNWFTDSEIYHLIYDGSEQLYWTRDAKCVLLSKKINELLSDYKKYSYKDSIEDEELINDADERLAEILEKIANNYNTAKTSQSNSRTSKSDLRYINNKHNMSSDLRNKFKNQWDKIIKTFNNSYQIVLGGEPSLEKVENFKKLLKGEKRKNDSVMGEKEIDSKKAIKLIRVYRIVKDSTKVKDF